VQTFQPDARPITYAARHDVRRFLAEELAAGLPGLDLLGPAPLLRLRGAHRAALIIKTERPRAVAMRAAALLASAATAMRRAGLSAVVDVDPQSL
jgi:primosomal protein N'